MSYLYKQKLNLLDLTDWQPPVRRILIFSQDGYLSRLYHGYLARGNYDVAICGSEDAIFSHVQELRPHLLIYHIHGSKPVNAVSARMALISKTHPDLKILTLASQVRPEELNEIMSAGICGHIDRRFSRPQDVVEIVKIILN